MQYLSSELEAVFIYPSNKPPITLLLQITKATIYWAPTLGQDCAAPFISGIYWDCQKRQWTVLVLWVDKAENTPEVQAVPSELDTWQGYFNTEDKVDGIISTSHVRKWKLKGVKYFFQAHTQ